MAAIKRGIFDPHPAFDHEAPFVRLVPAHPSDRAGVEPHVDAVKRLGDLQISSSRLPRPSARLALALARRSAFDGSLFQFPALALGRNPFGGSLFPVLLRMNAEIVP